VLATAQYLQATDNPFVAADVQRRGLSFFAEGRQGLTGLGRHRRRGLPRPDADNDFDAERRLIFGGAHWSEVGRGRLGIVLTLEQSVQTSNSELLGRRLRLQDAGDLLASFPAAVARRRGAIQPSATYAAFQASARWSASPTASIAAARATRARAPSPVQSHRTSSPLGVRTSTQVATAPVGLCSVQ
jgi:hypothetical protein